MIEFTIYEHPHPYRWSHNLAEWYLDLGWEIHEYSCINEKDYTNALVLRR